MPKEGSQYISLSVILTDSLSITGRNDSPQVFLKNVNALLKKMAKYINEYIENSSDESDKEDADVDTSGKEDSDKQN